MSLPAPPPLVLSLFTSLRCTVTPLPWGEPALPPAVVAAAPVVDVVVAADVVYEPECFVALVTTLRQLTEHDGEPSAGAVVWHCLCPGLR